MAAKKTTRAEAEDTPKTPRAPRKTESIIRNLRGVAVHIRLGSKKDPYRIELAPRGLKGDIATVPVSLQSDTAYVMGVDVLFEIITKTEAKAIPYDPSGYQQRELPQMIKEEDTVINTEDDWDGKRGTRAPQRRVGPNIVGKDGGVSGADEGLAEQFQKADGALPEGIQFDRRVKLERTTEAQNAALRSQTG